MSKKEFKKKMRQFAKFLCLAQVASDSGKHLLSIKKGNATNACEKGYDGKLNYILQAIKLSKGLQNIKVSHQIDNNMDVVLFDIVGVGQVSFHVPEGITLSECNSQRVWNEFKKGSPKTCAKLAKIYNLPHYKFSWYK